MPQGKRPVADTIRTALAHVLMSREGPAPKPGTRSYDHSRIRDVRLILPADGPTIRWRPEGS